MGSINSESRETILADLKEFIESNGSPTFYGGWGLQSNTFPANERAFNVRDEKHKGSISDTLADASGEQRPWSDFITAKDIQRCLDHGIIGFDSNADEKVRDFMLEPAPDWWWTPPAGATHTKGLAFKENKKKNPLQNFAHRKKIGRPITKLEYWSMPIAGAHGEGGAETDFYHGVKRVTTESITDRHNTVFAQNVLNVKACKSNHIFESFISILQEKVPKDYTEKDWEFLEIIQIQRSVSTHIKGHNTDTIWTSDPAKKLWLSKTSNFHLQSFLLYRLLTDPEKYENPFAKLGIMEEAAFRDEDGNVMVAGRAFDKGNFFAKVRECLTSEAIQIWDDAKSPPYGTDPTPKSPNGLGTHPNPGGLEYKEGGSGQNPFEDIVVAHAKKNYSEKADEAKHFYDWLYPKNYGQASDSVREGAVKDSLVSIFEGPRRGALSSFGGATSEGWVWDDKLDLGVQDLSLYDWSVFVDWKGVVNRGPSKFDEKPQMNKASSYLPKTIKTNEAEYTHAPVRDPHGRPSMISFRADVLSFNSDAKVQSGPGMEATTASGDEGTAKLLEHVVAGYNSYVGESIGGGLKSSGTVMNKDQRHLPTSWFAEQFKGGLIPSDKALTFKINFNSTTSDNEAWFTEDVRQSLKNLLPGITSVEFQHGPTPWETIYRKEPGHANWEIKEMPFEDLLDRYFLMAYFMYVTGRANVIEDIGAAKKTDLPSLLSTDYMDWYANKAAYHYRRAWDSVMQSHYNANLYSLYVLVVALGSADGLSEKDLENLAALVQAEAADLLEDVGFQSMPASTLEQEAGMSESSKEQRERFYKQCALMLNMHKLAEGNVVDNSSFHNKSKEAGYTSYNGRVHLVKNKGDKNTNIINKLISPTPKQAKAFTDVTTQEASKLMPYIRLYKVYNHTSAGVAGSGGLELREIPFPLYQKFTSNFKAMNMNTSGSSGFFNDRFSGEVVNLIPEKDAKGTILGGIEPHDRGKAVGIKEFSWEYDGETPATASKYVKAKLHLYFSNFSEFIRDRMYSSDGTTLNRYSYVDLFVSPTNIAAKSGPAYNAPHHLKYEPDYYRIRVDIGYHATNDMSDDMKKALQAQNTSFYLVLVDHEIQINEDMTVDVIANYRAYIEEAVDSQKFNALNSPEVKKMRANHMAMWDQAIKDKEAGKCSVQELNKVRSIINSQMAGLIKKQHKSIMTNLLKEDRIFFVDFDTPEIDNFRQNGFFGSIPTFKSISFKQGDLTDDAKKHLERVIDDSEPFSEHATPDLGLRVYYFYLGDLMYLLMSNLYKGEKPWVSSGIFEDEKRAELGAEKTKMLLMDFDYENILSQEQLRHTINIADIPVSVDYFFDWYVDNIIKNEVSQMPIGTFVRKILTELITEAMAEVCITGVEGHYVTFQYASCVAAPQKSVNGVYLDPISSALALNKANNETIDRVHSAEELAAGVPGVNTSETASTVETTEADEFGPGTSIEVPPPEPSLDEEGALTPGYQNTTLENQDTYRFDVNQFYGGEHLPLPRLPAEDAEDAANSQYNYMMIYGDFADPYHTGEGDEEADEAAGTYHFHLARDRGLVKNISFSKNNIPYHRESRMFNQGQAGNLQLSAVYDCSISMIGNTLFLPGMEIYINPFGFGGEEFGEPFERPLEYRSPSAASIRKYNDNHRSSLQISDKTTEYSDGQAGQSVSELTSLSTQLDALEAGVNPQNPTVGMPLPVTVNSYANLMGIGGYQLITGIQCSISPGKYETTIKAKHTYTGYPQIQQSQKLIEFRQNQESVSSADSGVTNACTAILKEQEIKFDRG